MIHHYLIRAWYTLARRDVASILILAVLLFAALGSCFPQRPPEIEINPEQLANWENNVHARFRGFEKVLSALGLFNFYKWIRLQ